jgi:hypothetical protein
VDSFLQVSPPKLCISLSSPPYTLHAPLKSFFTVLSQFTKMEYCCYCASHLAPPSVLLWKERSLPNLQIGNSHTTGTAYVLAYSFTLWMSKKICLENCTLVGYYAASSGNFLPTLDPSQWDQ